MSIEEKFVATTIQVSEQLRDALKEVGKKGESYEDVIWRLLTFYGEKHSETKRGSK